LFANTYGAALACSASLILITAVNNHFTILMLQSLYQKLTMLLEMKKLMNKARNKHRLRRQTNSSADRLRSLTLHQTQLSRIWSQRPTDT